MPDTALRTVAALKGHQTTKAITAADIAADRDAVYRQRRLAKRALKNSALRGPGSITGKGQDIVGGFYVSWDSASLGSLKQHASEMTHLFPGWLHLNEDGSQLVPKDSDPSDWEALRIARQNHLVIVPLLNNFSDTLQDFDDKRLHELLISPAKRANMVAEIKTYLLKNHYGGINIDLESDDEDDRALLPGFAAEFFAALHPLGLLVTEDTQAGDPVAGGGYRAERATS